MSQPPDIPSQQAIEGNVAARLTLSAHRWPDTMAIAEPLDRGRRWRPARSYRQLTFAELDRDSSHLAAGLRAMGVRPGMRMVLMVRPGINFISLVFALFKARAVTVLIDPGMGRSHLLRCLEEVEPEGFIGIPLVQAVRTLLARRFPQARCNLTVGRRWFWGGPTLRQLRARRFPAESPSPAESQSPTDPGDPAAIIFTTGSTGPPKGVLYEHGNFVQQAAEIQQFYGIQPGEIDLPGFPLFALFNCAMGVSTVIPVMDPTRPAQVDPRNIVEPIERWQITQAFGSPALWNTVGRYCEQHAIQMPTLRRVLSAGAPVPVHVLQRMRAAIHPEGDIHTPYGATEALPVASISGRQVLDETAARSAHGAGTCVGGRFPQIRWQVIAIDDGPLERIDQVRPLPAGQVGELMVSGPVVTRQYVTRTEANALHKVRDGDTVWHRLGDVGYLDDQDRFWFCGRKAHRVQASHGTMFTIPCEAILNGHGSVYRSALVGVGPPGSQRPVAVVETWPERTPATQGERERLLAELRELARSQPLTETVADVLWHPALPVDIRHNAKIFREKLAVWAAGQLESADRHAGSW
ncbi:MAG: AMP-binding protein [Pirellulaceae bacterium]|nr:AMP-binding protein [Pirellulaceae bacterium]